MEQREKEGERVGEREGGEGVRKRGGGGVEWDIHTVHIHVHAHTTKVATNKPQYGKVQNLIHFVHHIIHSTFTCISTSVLNAHTEDSLFSPCYCLVWSCPERQRDWHGC